MSMNTSENDVVYLNIADKLTSNSCGHIVVELTKFIMYQRLQIPYTYQWLKLVVNKRLLHANKKGSYQSELHFNAASSALKNLDFILNSLVKEITSAVMPEEICIILGATPYTGKEIYRFVLPRCCHKPQCQSNKIAPGHTLQRHVFQSLVTSKQLTDVLFSEIHPTNMYAFIKRRITSKQNTIGEDYVFTRGFKIPKNCKVVNVNFGKNNSFSVQCCNNFQIFGDISSDLNYLHINEEANSENFSEIVSDDDIKWFQSTYVMKGFKDCVVNGNSVTNTWI